MPHNVLRLQNDGPAWTGVTSTVLGSWPTCGKDASRSPVPARSSVLVAPAELKFTAGGTGDVRGWENRLLGPKVPDVRFTAAAGIRHALADGYRWADVRQDLMAGTVVGIVALPLAMAPLGLTLTTASMVVILAIATMGLNLLVGYTGLTSFGHGAWFGIGAYAAGLIQLRFFPGEIWLPLLGSIIVVAIASTLIGMLILRRRGVYFSLLTLALAALVYTTAFRWTSLTGGGMGLNLPVLSLRYSSWPNVMVLSVRNPASPSGAPPEFIRISMITPGDWFC